MITALKGPGVLLHPPQDPPIFANVAHEARTRDLRYRGAGVQILPCKRGFGGNDLAAGDRTHSIGSMCCN